MFEGFLVWYGDNVNFFIFRFEFGISLVCEFEFGIGIDEDYVVRFVSGGVLDDVRIFGGVFYGGICKVWYDLVGEC